MQGVKSPFLNRPFKSSLLDARGVFFVGLSDSQFRRVRKKSKQRLNGFLTSSAPGGVCE